jgi:transposase
MAIIHAICAGETQPEKLAAMRHFNCRKPEEEIARALQSNGRKDFLFALQQELGMYKTLQQKINACDAEIKNFLDQSINDNNDKRQPTIEKKPHKMVNKNDPKNIDLNLAGYQYFEGVDLLGIEGFSHSTLLTLMSEIGSDGIKNSPPQNTSLHG